MSELLQTLIDQQPDQRPIDVTVIVPTRNEAANVAPLLRRLDLALGKMRAEIMFVDDSDDDTPRRVALVAASSARPIRLLHRPPGDRADGLGGAVLTGLRHARGSWAVVMDGDLQHPPAVVPELVRTGIVTGADIVVGSRYAGAGAASGLASHTRMLVSSAATLLAKAVFPLRLRGCSDPMSGFFAVRLSQLDLDALRPKGFKILLEIFTRSSRLRLREVPFTFEERRSGASKATWREGLRYLRRLFALRIVTLLAARDTRLARGIGFGLVGTSGIAVNSAALWALVDVLSAPLLLAATLATQVSTTWNYVLTDRLVYRGARSHSATARFLGFALLNNAVLLLRLPLLSLAVHQLALNYLVANVITLIAAFAARFALSDRYLFAPARTLPRAPSDGNRRREGPVEVVVDLREVGIPRTRLTSSELPWRYDIHGIVTIGSAVRLKELDFFLTLDRDGGDAFDIEIRPGRFGPSRCRTRSRVIQYAALPAVSYEEHLGRFGSNFLVDMTDGIKVTVGPMLMRSPHVLYTNVVEALLRFVMVSRGYMLLHSACIELDGRGLMISALTDTGKTGTILRLLRERTSRFLSDDMTILRPDGTALCYPKPLTISQHTLRAVDAGELTSKEWRRLRLQSRLHSKEGRSVGARLGRMNVPIMSCNALTQLLVPPPKYFVERLVECQHTLETTVEQLFIIERGDFRVTDIATDGLIDELIANTDDAYGFPPFRYFAPALVIGQDGYEELRAKERMILARAMEQIEAQRLATPDFSWADLIPKLVGSRSATSPAQAEQDLTAAEWN